MKSIERLYLYFDYKHIKPTRFEKEIGLSNGYLGTQLRRKGNLGEEILNQIIDNCLDLSPEWLLTGRGDMLKDPQNNQSGEQVNDPKDEEIIDLQKFKIKKLEEEINALKRKLAELSDYHPMAAEPNPKLKK